jgi:hypothetical protein
VAPPPAASAPPTAGAPPAAAATATAAPEASEEERPRPPLPPGLGEKNLPAAPCDLSRVYRGSIGSSTITIQLSRSGEALQGTASYDLSGAPIEMTGTYRGDTLILNEKGAGRFQGTCDGKTGQLSGTYELKKKTSPFALAPRPLGEAAIHSIRERVSTRSPVPPSCARLGRTTESRTVNGRYCLPNDPKALAELQEESGVGLCSLELWSPRVFGLANPAAERLANAALTHDGFGYAAPDVRATVNRCPLYGEMKVSGGFQIVHNQAGVLSVFFSGWVSETGAAHGAGIGPAGVNVDLQTGRRLVIGDLVTSESAFRDAILGCVTGDPGEFTWGTPDAFRKAPRWVIVTGGIAVVIGDVAPIMHGAEGTGPVASFAALAGRRLLRGDSPVARLWAGVKPAASNAPLCPTSL